MKLRYWGLSLLCLSGLLACQIPLSGTAGPAVRVNLHLAYSGQTTASGAKLLLPVAPVVNLLVYPKDQPDQLTAQTATLAAGQAAVQFSLQLAPNKTYVLRGEGRGSVGGSMEFVGQMEFFLTAADSQIVLNLCPTNVQTFVNGQLDTGVTDLMPGTSRSFWIQPGTAAQVIFPVPAGVEAYFQHQDGRSITTQTVSLGQKLLTSTLTASETGFYVTFYNPSQSLQAWDRLAYFRAAHYELWLWDSAQWSRSTDIVPPEGTIDLCPAAGTDLLALTDDGQIWKFSQGQWAVIAGLVLPARAQHLVASSSALYVSSDFNVYEFSDGAWSTWPTATVAAIQSVFGNASGAFTWCADGNIYEWSAGAWNLWPGLAPPVGTLTVVSGGNEVLALTSSKLYQWDQGTWRDSNLSVVANIKALAMSQTGLTALVVY